MKTLRARLTWLYTITTGSILLLVVGAFLLYSVQDTRKSQLEQFEVIWSSLSSRFMASGALTHEFLAQTEANHCLVIHIVENGVPFLYRGSWKPDTDRGTLIERAKAEANLQGVFMDRTPVSSSVLSTPLMTIEGDHKDRYYARVLSVSTKNGSKSLCALSLIPPVLESLKGTIAFFCLLAGAGIACLWLVSWRFVGWSLKPVEESQQKQARFIAAASHELRSPLSVLRSAVSALSQEPNEKDTLLPLIDSECARMSRLVDDMLFLASADAKSWSLLSLEKVDMDTLLIDLYESFRPACRERGITLRLDLPQQSLPQIPGDPQRIRQLLLILLDNARTYTPPEGSVTIRARFHASKKLLTIQVADEGCGVPDHVKPYIFDRFYQADRSRTDKQHFGLGLSIARELVQLHGGTIQVSDEPGGGACFSVSFPVGGRFTAAPHGPGGGQTPVH